jgi:hypothetical protein
LVVSGARWVNHDSVPNVIAAGTCETAASRDYFRQRLVRLLHDGPTYRFTGNITHASKFFLAAVVTAFAQNLGSLFAELFPWYAAPSPVTAWLVHSWNFCPALQVPGGNPADAFPIVVKFCVVNLPRRIVRIFFLAHGWVSLGRALLREPHQTGFGTLVSGLGFGLRFICHLSFAVRPARLNDEDFGTTVRTAPHGLHAAPRNGVAVVAMKAHFADRLVLPKRGKHDGAVSVGRWFGMFVAS